MSKPLLVDLFCGAGGAAVGYHRAGFEVFGVDLNPQPHYPFEFLQADVLNLEPSWIAANFDAVHASPPCQENTPMNNRAKKNGWDIRWLDLIAPTRALLEAIALPYIIENVIGAVLRKDLFLTGEMFGLTTSRPRIFELGGWFSLSPPKSQRTHNAIAVYGKPDGRRLWTREDGSQLRAWSSLTQGQEALGVPWMQTELEIREAIPPAYTQFIGEQLLAHLQAEKVANLD